LLEERPSWKLNERGKEHLKEQQGNQGPSYGVVVFDTEYVGERREKVLSIVSGLGK